VNLFRPGVRRTGAVVSKPTGSARQITGRGGTPAACRKCSRGWRLLGLGALLLSSLFALVPVFARNPLVVALFPLPDLFGRGLVTHVTLSMLVWIWSAAAALWVATARIEGLLPRVSLGLGWVGAALMTLLPWTPEGAPRLFDYLPLIDSPLYFAGLLAFLSGVALMALGRVWQLFRDGLHSLTDIGLTGVALAFLSALTCFTLAALTLDARLLHEAGLAEVTWGGGHVLQLGSAMLLATVWMMRRGEPQNLAQLPRWVVAAFLAGMLPIVLAPFLYLLPRADIHQAFTMLMAWGGWLPAFPLAIWVLACFPFRHEVHAGSLCWRLSALLFVMGVLVGAMIRDNSAMVPAHYHGVVGAVTLALMGQLLHDRLPGLTRVRRVLATYAQGFYGFGSLGLVLVLAVAGMMGLERKGAPLSDLPMVGQLLAWLLALFASMAILGATVFTVVLILRHFAWPLPEYSVPGRPAGLSREGER